MKGELSDAAVSDLKLWIENNIRDQFYICPTDFLKFLEDEWTSKHYPDFRHVIPILVRSQDDSVAYRVYVCKSQLAYELYAKNKFVIQSEFQFKWMSYLIDNNLFSFRIWCNIFGVEILRSCD